MNKNIVIGIIVVVVIAIGGWFVWGQNTKAPETQTPLTQTNTTNNTDQNNTIQTGIDIAVTTVKNYDVILTDNGYSPNSLTIKAGDTVTFKNESSGGMWTGSAMHPTHTVYSGTTLQQHCPDTANNSFDQCKSEPKGTSWSFTFNKIGTWGYHNHVQANQFGKIIVE